MSSVGTRILCVLRVALGALFVYLGAIKALDPVGFLKLVRAYDIVQSPPALNVIAAVLPWFEIVCGLALIAGFKRRAAALLQLLLLVGFTIAILLRAAAIHRATGMAFAAIRFDCGCGTGEVLLSLKLAENAALVILSAIVVAAVPDRGRR